MSGTPKQDGILMSIKDFWYLALHNWYWFLISVLITLSVTLIYIVITPPTFTRTASVLIKNNNSNRQSVSSGTESLSEFGLLKPNTDIKSEVYVLKSPVLMEIVVERLKLNYNYSVDYKFVRNVDIYNSTPILVAIDSTLTDTRLSFVVNLLAENKFILSDIVVNGIESNSEIDGTLSDTVKTEYGSIVIVPTAAYSSNSVGKNIYFSKSTVSTLAEAYSSKLEVVYDEKDAPILWLSYMDVNVQRAEDILNTLISVYNENWIKDRNHTILSTSDFISKRLAVIETELGGVDSDISSYKSANLITNVDAVSNMYLAQSSNNANRQITLQNQLSMARYIRSYMSEVASQNQLIPANTGIESSNIEGQIDRYNSLLLQKNNLLANSSEQNPVIVDMTKSLTAMKDVIVRSIDDYISTLNIQVDNIRQEENATNQKLASNPDQAKYLLSVERQQTVKEALYLFLLQKREENELSQTFSAYNTKVINSPRGSKIPTAPRKNVILFAAFVIGLLIPAIILILIENLDSLVRGRGDLSELTLPFLGEIPILDRKKRKFWQRKVTKGQAVEKVKIVVAAQKRNIINEAFRNIRNNIDFMMHPEGDKGMVIMITSLFAGSGKTFISSNIALSMAVKGARTIILDVDLRKATLSQLMDSPKKGLSDYLASKIDSIEQVIVKSEINHNLDVIPAGKIAPNPSELILGKRFGELIISLRSKYDYIFLDCPPVEVVSETAIIGGVCDMTLFVVRVGMFDKCMLPEIEQIYKTGQFKNMGIILNGVDYSASQYGYSKYGYSKYGYSNDLDDDIGTINNNTAN